MSLARIKTWIPGEVLTASDLNSEFSNPLDNALSMISPLTGTLDVDGNQLTLDAAGNTTVVSSAAVSWNFTSGNKTGTPATTGSVVNYSAQTFTDNATAASGTAASYVGYAIQRPTLAASNATVTTTNAATFYIPNNVAAGTNETITNSWSLWVDAGNVRFDDDVYWLSGTSFNGILAHANSAARTYTFPDTTGTVALTSDVASAAAQSDQETATSTTTFVSPGRQQYHPSAPKAWGEINGTSVSVSYPSAGTSVTNPSTGVYTVTHGLTFSSTNYIALAMSKFATCFVIGNPINATSISFSVYDSTGALTNAVFYYALFGDL